MATSIMVDISTADIAIELADSGSDLADLVNEIALQKEPNNFQLTDQEMVFFRQRLDEDGKILLRQLVSALDAEGI